MKTIIIKDNVIICVNYKFPQNGNGALIIQDPSNISIPDMVKIEPGFATKVNLTKSFRVLLNFSEILKIGYY